RVFTRKATTLSWKFPICAFREHAPCAAPRSPIVFALVRTATLSRKGGSRGSNQWNCSGSRARYIVPLRPILLALCRRDGSQPGVLRPRQCFPCARRAPLLASGARYGALAMTWDSAGMAAWKSARVPRPHAPSFSILRNEAHGSRRYLIAYLSCKLEFTAVHC